MQNIADVYWHSYLCFQDNHKSFLQHCPKKGKWQFCQLARKSSGSPFFFLNPGVIGLYDNIASVWANGKLSNTIVTFKFLFIALNRTFFCQSGADSREDYMFTPYS